MSLHPKPVHLLQKGKLIGGERLDREVSIPKGIREGKKPTHLDARAIPTRPNGSINELKKGMEVEVTP